MIYVGLTGWGEHHSLYETGMPGVQKLQAYSAHFPVVELDATYYAIQAERSMQRWAKDTPDSFRFVVKAYQGMTGHLRGKLPFTSREEMFTAFLQSIQPLVESHKLQAVLFQYPPWFACKKENVDMIRITKEQMQDIPVAIEFRNQSWFRGENKERTLEFLQQQGWIHSVCDEPQVGEGSAPAIIQATHPDLTIVRMHGRNTAGWINNGEQNWREVRFLYRYNQAELEEWQQHVLTLHQQSKDVVVLFNNNSGGDAADNAKAFIKLCDLEYEGLGPRQINIFEV